MKEKKPDGIIEAVHYQAGDGIDFVRLYERLGAIWSDRLLLTRTDLVERLKSHKRIVIGERQNNLGGVFNTRSTVVLKDGSIITEDQADAKNKRDWLAQVPVI